MTLAAILEALPARQGHFVLESGYHTDFWLTLDALFVDPRQITPLVEALAEQLRPHAVSAICGPMIGGAFLAQRLATALGADFYYTTAKPGLIGTGLFQAEYHLPAGLQPRARGQRVAVADDVISAGSSVRATVAALTAAGATTAVVAALLVLGDAATKHFASLGVPVEALSRRAFTLWQPGECPLCRAGTPLEEPRKRTSACCCSASGSSFKDSTTS